ncbi:MAG: PQQ-like beta-propeller repeat protein [Methylacidiphilales bacterium]|nr:PQQ-like beta-propeller repeat protein [Candidatus Methylacidiphilales bacterium]
MKTIAITLLLLCTGFAQAADWPQWRGPNHDGISTETGWSTQWNADGPKQLFKLNVGTGCSSVAVSQGHLYTIGNTNNTDTVRCLDAATGKEIWKQSYPCPLDPNSFEGGPGATPAVNADRVYTMSRAGDLHCLDAATGKVVWTKNLVKDFGGKVPKWGYAGSPVVLEKCVILDVGAPGAATVALDKTTGEIAWKNGDEEAAYATPLPFEFGGKKYVALFDAFGLVIREADGGKTVAKQEWKTNYDVNAATPIISGDKLFVSSGYGKGAAQFQFTGSELKYIWQTKKMRNHFNSCVLWQGFLYGFDDTKLACLDFATGDVKWVQEDLGKGSLMLADGKLIIQSENGDLVIASAAPDAFKELARAKVLDQRCWVVPVLANGHIYCKNNVGDLVALDVSGK